MLQNEIFRQRSNPLSRSVTVTWQNDLQMLQNETSRHRRHPLLPFLFVNIERLYVPPLGAHDVADQTQEETDARGVKTVL